MQPLTLIALQTRVNQVIQSTMTTKIAQAKAIDGSYERLWRQMQDLISSGGKRMRPYMTYLSYETFDGPASDAIYQVAAAQELLHFALLIHDDIIDRDTLRYGRQNIAGAYRSIYKNAGEHAQHFAAGAALLAGDAALSLAYELIATSSFSLGERQRASQVLAWSLFSVIGGELLDMEGSCNLEEQANYHKIAQYKTASYSFVGPLHTGALLAGASGETLNHLTILGNILGTMYQLSDDMLGLYGSEEETGKPITSDLREGKKTYLFDRIIERSGARDQTYLASVMGNQQVTRDDVMRVRAIGIKNGAKQDVELYLERLALEAREALDLLHLPHDKTQPYDALITQSLKRTT
jgi:geranylgeranyl pyrophosphate synthase